MTRRVSSLDICPDECFCYHSWNEGDVIVTDCSMEYQDLSWNKVKKICPHTLRMLVKLKYLILSNNMINNIHEDFQNLQNLVHLTLNNNLFDEIPRAVQHMKKLEFIEISRNALKCDFNTFWMTA